MCSYIMDLKCIVVIRSGQGRNVDSVNENVGKQKSEGDIRMFVKLINLMGAFVSK